jgi:hypothetical protein
MSKKIGKAIWLLAIGLAVFVGMASAAGRAETTQQSIYLSVGTGSTGGTYFIWGNAIVTMLNEKVGYIEATPESVSGSAHASRMVNLHQLDIAGAGADMPYYGYRGAREFTEKLENIRAIYPLPMIGQTLVSLKSSAIRTIDDLRGKVITVNSASGETQLITYLGKYGLSKEKGDYRTQILTYTEAAQALLDGSAHVSMQVANPPGGSMMDLATTVGVNYIAIPESVARSVAAEHPYWPIAVIPKGRVEGLNQDVIGFPMAGVIIAHKDVPDSVIYDFCKAIADNTQLLAQTHASLGVLTADFAKQAIEGNIAGIPWHPGAIKFLQEKGAAIPASAR